MSERLTNLLGYLTLFAILGAIWVLFGEDPTRDQGGRGEPTFEGMRDGVNSVNRLTFEKGDAQTTLVRHEGRWGVAERGDYQADTEKVRAFLRGVALSERRDPKTSSPDRFPEIGLGTEALKVSLSVDDDEPLLSFDMGKQSTITADRSLTYIWQEKDTRSWLVTSLSEAEADPAFWLETGLLNISSARIKSIRLGELVLERGLEERDFGIEGLAEGETSVASWRLGEPARVLAGLAFDDVRQLRNPLTDPASTILLTTHDGLSVSLRLHDMEGATWAQLAASHDPDVRESGVSGELADAPADGAAEALAITEKSRGWFFRLSEADARVLLQSRGDFVEAAQQ